MARKKTAPPQANGAKNPEESVAGYFRRIFKS
jgi:hypothetical protein